MKFANPLISELPLVMGMDRDEGVEVEVDAKGPDPALAPGAAPLGTAAERVPRVAADVDRLEIGWTATTAAEELDSFRICFSSSSSTTRESDDLGGGTTKDL